MYHSRRSTIEVLNLSESIDMPKITGTVGGGSSIKI